MEVRDDWIIGVASTEIPWLGSIKLLTTGAWPAVPNASWTKLSFVIGAILILPILFDTLRGASEKSGKEDRDHNQGEDE